MKNIISMVVVLVLILGTVGCKIGGARTKTTTDWSLPSVKLPSAKKGDSVVKPADRANAKATAELAHDRQAGHNPAAAADGEDASLRPNPAEVAELSRFEGSDLPAWATQTEVPPEAVAGTAPKAETETTIPAIDTSHSPSANAGTIGSLAGELPASLDDGGLPASLDGGLPPVEKENAVVPTNTVASEIPAGLPTEAATYPQTGNMPNLGASVSELPGSVTPAAATVPAHATPQAEPAVLFAPGNISPSYPTAAPSRDALDATSTAPLWR